MDLKYNFCKAIQILCTVYTQTRTKKYTTINEIYKDTLLAKIRIREIVKVLKQKNILSGHTDRVKFEVDVNELTFKEIKQSLGKEEFYLYYQSENVEENKVKAFKKCIEEKFTEVEETIDHYWEHLTIPLFQHDIHSVSM